MKGRLATRDIKTLRNLTDTRVLTADEFAERIHRRAIADLMTAIGLCLLVMEAGE